MPKLIQTPRLELRPVSLADFDFLKAMNTNPEIMAHIGSGTIRTLEQVREALDRYLALGEEQPILGEWVVKEKATQKDIGTFILRHPATLEKVGGIEVGFSYLPETWGKGFATEAAKAVIEYVLKELPGEKVIAMVDAKNEASKKVLSKIGMELVGETLYVNPVTGDQKECLLLEFRKSS